MLHIDRDPIMPVVKELQDLPEFLSDDFEELKSKTSYRYNAEYNTEKYDAVNYEPPFKTVNLDCLKKLNPQDIRR